MGFLGKFTNWVSNKAQGISNKLGNAWNTVKGTASKVWEGTKDAAKATGKFIYDNSDAIAAGLGGLAAGVAAGYGVDPSTILGVREAVGGVANMLPEGKVKSALLSAAWKQKSSPDAETPKLDLSKMVPGGMEYAMNLLGKNSGGDFKHRSNISQYMVPGSSAVNPVHVADPTKPIVQVKKKSNKKKHKNS